MTRTQIDQTTALNAERARTHSPPHPLTRTHAHIPHPTSPPQPTRTNTYTCTPKLTRAQQNNTTARKSCPHQDLQDAAVEDVVVLPCNGSAAQKWEFSLEGRSPEVGPPPGQLVTVRQKSSGYLLSVKDCARTPHTVNLRVERVYACMREKN